MSRNRQQRDRSTEGRQARQSMSKAQAELDSYLAQKELDALKEQEEQESAARDRAKADLKDLDIEFDWSDLTMAESEQVAETQIDLMEAQKLKDAEERKQALRDGHSEMQGWFAKVVKRLPLDWFGKQFIEGKTIDDIDFGDPATYANLLDVRWGRLMNAMNIARDQAEKN